MEKPTKTHIVSGIGILGVMGAVLMYFQFTDAIEARTTTQAELVAAFEKHHVQDIEPMRKDIQQQQRRWDRDDYKFYIEKLCVRDELLSRPDQEDFEEILARLGYEWRGCSNE